MATGSGQTPWVDSSEGQKPTKRISTPAGNRLSAILNDGSGKSRWSRNDASANRMAAPVIPPIEDLGMEDSSDSGEQTTDAVRTSTAPNTYATSVHSEKSIFAPQQEPVAEKPKRNLLGSWSRKKLFIVVGVIGVALIALIIGLAVGLSQHSSSSSDNSTVSSAGSGSATVTSGRSSPTGLSTLATVTTLPKDFPVGKYSMFTFLDTMYTNCTSDPAAWTCSPGVIYNNDHVKAASTFHFNITRSGESYQIEPFGSDTLMKEWNFRSTALEMENAGKDNERYHFQVNADKTVFTRINGTDAICDFPSTTFSGYLYTKLAKTYPASDQVPATSDSTWPFQMTFEANNGGGDGVSKCADVKTIKTISAVTGQTFGDTCSCFYRNWTPLIPT